MIQDPVHDALLVICHLLWILILQLAQGHIKMGLQVESYPQQADLSTALLVPSVLTW